MVNLHVDVSACDGLGGLYVTTGNRTGIEIIVRESNEKKRVFVCNFCLFFNRTGISYPNLNALDRRMGKEDEFEELKISSLSILPPRGASEIEIKAQQVCRSGFECGFEVFLYVINRYTQVLFCFIFYEVEFKLKVCKSLNRIRGN